MVPSETRTATARCLAAGKIVVVVEMSRMWESSSRPPFARWTRPDADPCEVRVRQFDFVVWNTKTTASRKHQQTQEASENVWTRHNAEVCGRACLKKSSVLGLRFYFLHNYAWESEQKQLPPSEYRGFITYSRNMATLATLRSLTV